MSLAMKILSGLLVVGVIAVVLVLLLTEEDAVKGTPLWVVVGEDDNNFGKIMYSKSGEKWTDSSDKGASFNDDGNGVAYGLDENNNPLWVAAGGDNKEKATNILYSTNGKFWTQSDDSGASFREACFGVAYGLSSDKKTGLWVAVGDNTTGGGACAGNILYSTDGKKWNQSDDSGASFRTWGNGIAYGLSSDKKTGLWVAVGHNDTTGGGACTGNILFSTDGKKWEQSDDSGASFRRWGKGVAYGLSSDKKTGLWVAVGNNYTIYNDPPGPGACAGNILFSTDGKKWEQSDNSGASFRYQGRGVAYGLSSDKKTGLWVAVGDNKTPANFGTGAYAGNILFSTDGKKWQQSNGEGASFRRYGSGVAYGLDENNNPLWVATGNNYTYGGGEPAGNILYSTDGQFWQQSDSSGASFASYGSGAAFGKILNEALQ